VRALQGDIATFTTEPMYAPASNTGHASIAPAPSTEPVMTAIPSQHGGVSHLRVGSQPSAVHPEAMGASSCHSATVAATFREPTEALNEQQSPASLAAKRPENCVNGQNHSEKDITTPLPVHCDEEKAGENEERDHY
jgi:hypothetical protein